MPRLSNHWQQVGCFPHSLSQQLQAQLQAHAHLQVAQAQLLHLLQELSVSLQEQEQGIVLVVVLLVLSTLPAGATAGVVEERNGRGERGSVRSRPARRGGRKRTGVATGAEAAVVDVSRREPVVSSKLGLTPREGERARGGGRTEEGAGSRSGSRSRSPPLSRRRGPGTPGLTFGHDVVWFFDDIFVIPRSRRDCFSNRLFGGWILPFSYCNPRPRG